MGLFDKLFKRPEQNFAPEGYFKTLTAYSPAFTSFGGAIYESELVRAAINARATHISKLKVEIFGSASPRLRTKLLKKPNDFQTWGQFLYRLSTILDVQNTAFIVPVYDQDGAYLTGFYPVLPSRCALKQFKGEPFLQYEFSTGTKAAIELSACGVMTRYQYSDDFFGETNNALSPTMELINMQNQGISEGIKNSATYRFMAQLSNFSKSEDLAKERKRFNSTNFQEEGGGILLFPNTYSNIQQITSKPFVVDADQMSSIRNNVFEYFGVNEDVIQNKAYGDAWSAFYEGAIEPFAIQFSDVVTKMAFSEREIANGAGIMATANRLQYMTTQEKLNVSSQMADRGIMNRDEIRDIWNLSPLPDGQGQAYTIRGEYYLMNSDGTATQHGDDVTSTKTGGKNDNT
jgi:hypothetical protein